MTFTITAESTVFEPRAITQQNAHSITTSRTKTPVAFETGFSVPKNAFINRGIKICVSWRKITHIFPVLKNQKVYYVSIVPNAINIERDNG
jgi:hypothetical protein